MEELSNEYELENIENEEDMEDEEDDYEEIESMTSNANSNSQAKSSKRKRSSDSKYCNKKRKCRTTFSKSQLSTLEKEFLSSNFVSNDRIDLIIELTGLDSRIIKNWFKNKRSRVLADTKTTSPGATINVKTCASTDTFTAPTILTNSASMNSQPHLETHQKNTTSTLSQQQSQQHQLFIQTSNLSSNFKENRLIETCTYSQSQSENTYSHASCKNVISTRGKSTNEMLTNKGTNGLLNILNTSDINYKNDQEKVGTKKTTKRQLEKTKSAKRSESTTEVPVEYKDSFCPRCLKLAELFCSCNVSQQALKKLYSNLNGYDMRFLNKNTDTVEFQLLDNCEGFQKRINLETNCADLLLDINGAEKSFEIL